MDYKKINLTLLVIIFVLILILICIVFKTLFFDGSSFEWGSFTDWISSLSTFLTLIVAWKAYRAAPQWIKEKQKEEGFNHTKALMSEYDQIVATIKELHHDILYIKRSDKKFDVLVEKISKEIYRTFDLNHKLESCSRWNITYLKEVPESMSRLTAYYNTSFAIMTFKGITASENPDIINNELIALKNQIDTDISFFNKPIQELFTFPQ